MGWGRGGVGPSHQKRCVSRGSSGATSASRKHTALLSPCHALCFPHTNQRTRSAASAGAHRVLPVHPGSTPPCSVPVTLSLPPTPANAPEALRQQGLIGRYQSIQEAHMREGILLLCHHSLQVPHSSAGSLQRFTHLSQPLPQLVLLSRWQLHAREKWRSGVGVSGPESGKGGALILATFRCRCYTAGQGVCSVLHISLSTCHSLSWCRSENRTRAEGAEKGRGC